MTGARCARQPLDQPRRDRARLEYGHFLEVGAPHPLRRTCQPEPAAVRPKPLPSVTTPPAATHRAASLEDLVGAGQVDPVFGAAGRTLVRQSARWLRAPRECGVCAASAQGERRSLSREETTCSTSNCFRSRGSRWAAPKRQAAPRPSSAPGHRPGRHPRRRPGSSRPPSPNTARMCRHCGREAW